MAPTYKWTSRDEKDITQINCQYKKQQVIHELVGPLLSSTINFNNILSPW